MGASLSRALSADRGTSTWRSQISRSFTVLWGLSLGLGVALSSCSTTPATNSTAAQPVEGKTIRIGYQKFGTLNILKAKGNLEQRLKPQGISVQWTQFPAGPQLLEALNAGSIDFGHTGEAPPVFAQAAGAPLVYVANQTPNPKGEGILVRQNAPIQSVKDLRGKKIALNKGSNVHFFLLQALKEAGVNYADVKPVFLPPADARAAFDTKLKKGTDKCDTGLLCVEDIGNGRGDED